MSDAAEKRTPPDRRPDVAAVPCCAAS